MLSDVELHLRMREFASSCTCRYGITSHLQAKHGQFAVCAEAQRPTIEKGMAGIANSTQMQKHLIATCKLQRKALSVDQEERKCQPSSQSDGTWNSCR